MATNTEVKEVPTIAIPLVDKKGNAISKHVALRKVLAADFAVDILNGNLADVDTDEIIRWKEAIVKLMKAFDEKLLSMPEDSRDGMEPFRKPRTDKGTKSVDPEDFLG